MIITKRLTTEKPIIFDSAKERIINITTISLESVDKKFPIDIYFENKRKKEIFKICSLKKGFQEMYNTSLILDLHDFKDKYEFTLKTKCKKALVNIIGFYDEEEDEEKEEKIQEKPKIEKKEIKKKKEKIEKIEEKETPKEKSDSDSDSNSDSNDNDLEDNKPNVSLVELLNKKRKEEPQEIKPITLKNLSGNTINDYKDIKKEKNENKNKDKNLLGKKSDNKNKKFIKNKIK